MSKGNILVTGGAGYVGSHACKALYESGYTPISFDSMEYGHDWAIQWGPGVVGNLNNSELLRETFNRYEPMGVMHFAAYAYVGESVSDPRKYYLNNVSGTLKLLDVMIENNCKKIVFSSTCATYGLPSELPISENEATAPLSPYGASKLMVERVLQDYGAAYGLVYASLRYFNAAGADPDGSIGELHKPETHLIPLVLDVAAGMSECIYVYGGDYQTSDGTCIRDYVHVSDLATAHVLAFEHISGTGSSDVFNLGTGLGFSVLDVINACERVTGERINIKFTDKREGDAPELIASAEKAKRVLGWDARLSNLDSIVETAWQWHRKSRKI